MASFKPQYLNVLTKDFLKEQYIFQKRSGEDIAKEVGCDPTTVRTYIRKHGLRVRTVSQSLNNKEKILIDKKLLHVLYRNKKNSLREVAKILKCDKGTVRRRLKKLNRQIKSKSQAISEVFRKNPERCSNWRGGLSVSPIYKNFNFKKKEEIRLQDNYQCQLCGLYQNDNYLLFNRRLEIHHIDYDKLNGNSDNLITLCRVCHARTNFHREEWTKYFRIKNSNKFKGK